MKHFFIVLCALIASIIVSAQAANADSCPIRIAYAGIVGLGTQHGTAEYELDFGPDVGYDTGPFTVVVAATLINGSQVDVSIGGVSTRGFEMAKGTSVVRVFPFTAEVGSFRVVSARDWKGLSTCDDAAYAVGDGDRSTSVSFDDGPQSKWPTTSAGTIDIVDADFVNKVAPDYPQLARKGQIEGDATVLVVIGPDGTLADAEVYQSSGSDVLDQASLDAARKTTFKPARLSAALGGAPVKSAYIIIYTFHLDG